jgi:hypothetical protein
MEDIMNNQILWIAGEESPTKLENSINIHAERTNLNLSFTNQVNGFPVLTMTQLNNGTPNQYEIHGLTVQGFSSVRYLVVKQGKILKSKGKGSFVDFLFFHQSHTPDPSKDIPIHAIEHTKNSMSESGNMSNQRSSKFIGLIDYYGANKVLCSYVVESNKHAENIGNSHLAAFSRMAKLGAEVYFCTENVLGFTKISPPVLNSIYDITNSHPAAFLQNGDLILEASLKNGQDPNRVSDPSSGLISSFVRVVSAVDKNVTVVLRNSGKDQDFFDKKTNKLTSALSGCNVMLELFNGSRVQINPKKLNRQTYWQYCNTGEKLSSISLEVLLKNQGWLLMFSNHAGCGKSNIFSPSGEVRTLKKSKDYGQKGIPDLVLYNKSLNLCLIIEAETSANYNKEGKGVNQVLLPEFKACFREQFLPLLPKGTVCEAYVCTFGARVQQQHNFFSLTPNGGLFFEQNAKPIWRVKR